MKNLIKTFIFNELIFHANPAAFGDEENLFEAGLDSMGVMRLILFIEEHCQVVIPDSEVTPENLQNLNAIVACIERQKL